MTEIEERLAKCPFCGHRDMKMIDAIKGIDAHYLIVCINRRAMGYDV
ncbi:hypothetical protein [Veillonella magna]|nr:hypothetical protein [Veillonella magna]